MSSLHAEPISYPDTRKDNVTDTYHGVKVDDPYRWLEDDNSPETKAWVTSQNEVTEKYLASIPSRSEIRERLKKLWNYERFGLPQEEGGKWFYSMNSGLQDQAVLYTSDSLDGERRVLIDPNAFSKDGTVALSQHEVSEDGKLIAYATSGGGSDWNEIRVREVATGKDLTDHLRWVKFSGISWAKDGSGFYYSRYPAAPEGAALTQVNENQKIYFHRLGEPQEKDSLIYERTDQPRWGLGGWISEDGDYLLIHLSQGTDPKNRFAYRSAKEKDAKVVDLLPDGDASYGFIGNIGPVFYFLTDLKAPRNRLIAIDTRKPERENWTEVIPQTKDKLDTVSLSGGKLFAIYMKDAVDKLYRFDIDGKNKTEIHAPGIGSIGGLGGKQKDKEVFYAFTSFTEPPAVYKLDIATGESMLWKKPDVDFDGAAYETKQVFFKSKDGTRVPMFITHKKGIQLDGSHRTLMYGYGGFQISLQPGFSIPRAVWLERGGIAVTVNLRGGGEYGSEWHNGGRRLNKQNVFDDFIAAGEKLIADGYTNPANLAIQGGSNGGLLVGACLTQRPDLFGAALPAVGVMDMLRFQKFTIGWAWEKDYGSSDDAEEFKLLHRYSPYHALKPGTRYPATLVTTADHDDRVVPAHSFKFAARLQECQAKDGPPVLIRIDTSAGHGAGTALSKVIDRTADEWAFLEASLGK
ncbi:MAG TPA: prolyl oligopeptidase family serine peptidase [Luteolibacter sp.]|nr:prolyl oligopeptidase family serine peptidase [Luteolibacter sp.]